jgi:trehalose synthase
MDLRVKRPSEVAQARFALREVPVSPLPPGRFTDLLDADRHASFQEGMAPAEAALRGRRMWHVNSTATGGGVAEMLRSFVGDAQGAGIDAHWVVVDGNDDFFAATKRIHNLLHGSAGDGGGLGEAERQTYESTLAPAASELAALVEPGDVVVLHDPQTLGLAPAVSGQGAACIWRCHVGSDEPNDQSRLAWSFLRPYLDDVDIWVFSREAHVWEGLAADRTRVIPPFIDAFTPKNQPMDDTAAAAILQACGLVAGPAGEAQPSFTASDGSVRLVSRQVELVDGGAPPPADASLVTQISRWDRLKDPVGVMKGFVQAPAIPDDVHLVIAGPSAASVSDDPEGAEVLEECQRCWEALPAATRGRVHLACLPMDDIDENAAIVNALQRRASVVVQKSLAEGFGLTVAEAMWKTRPVVASRVGGIQDQIVDGVSGVLIDDPGDLDAYGEALAGLLTSGSNGMGTAARERVKEHFLAPAHLLAWARLSAELTQR